MELSDSTKVATMTESEKLNRLRSLIIFRCVEISRRKPQVSYLIDKYDGDGTRERQGRYMLIHSNLVQEELRLQAQLEIIDG